MSDLNEKKSLDTSGQNPENGSDPNEIDDFTQRLLDRQTEYLLFPEMEEDVTTSSLEGSMSSEQRRIAEKTMLSALDQMRKERGQVSIEEEESWYRKPSDSSSAHSSRNRKQKKTEENHLEPGRYEVEQNGDPKPEVRQTRKPKKFYQTPHFRIAVVLVIILGVLFGAYAWKVTVYNPTHIASASQDEAYKRLVNYADEFSMMSDAQKRTLTDLEADYNNLPQAKKDEINAYFKDSRHTGYDFPELLAQMKENSMAADNPAFSDLLTFAQGYNSAAEEVKREILTKIDAYNALDADAKAKIDEAMKQTTGKTFTQVYQEMKDQDASLTAPLPEEEQSAQDTPAVDPTLQAQLDQLRADRDNYAQFLAGEGETTDSVLEQYDAQIAELESMMGISQ